MSLTKVWNLKANGNVYNTVLGSRKDVNEEFLKPDKKTFDTSKITMEEIGVMVQCRIIYYEDLELNTREEIISMKEPMIKAILFEDFDNDNMTYFLLERGLLNEDRKSLSNKGYELRNAWYY